MKPEFLILGEKGGKLLRILVVEIKSGRIKKREPKTFISYGEALDKLGIERHGRAGQQLRREGLDELNEWTKGRFDLPTVTGLIVEKHSKKPAAGFFKSHGREGGDWREWWLHETDRAIDFDWSRYLKENPHGSKNTARVKEEANGHEYRDVITIEAGKRGGRPCIRGMRITVGDVLGWLAVGMTEAEIIDDFPELTPADIHAALAFAANREKRAKSVGHEIAL
jgi:uncharacterized protein (DUF433 family)